MASLLTDEGQPRGYWGPEQAALELSEALDQGSMGKVQLWPIQL